MKEKVQMLGRRLLFASFVMLAIYIFMVQDGQAVHLLEWILLACIIGVSASVIGMARVIRKKEEEEKAVLIPADAGGILGKRMRAMENVLFLYAKIFRDLAGAEGSALDDGEEASLETGILVEERLLLGEQMRDLGRMVCRQRLEMGSRKRVRVDEAKLRHMLKNIGVSLNSGIYMENRWQRKEVTLDVTVGRGHRVTTGQIGAIVSELFGVKMVCDAQVVVLVALTRRQLNFSQQAGLTLQYVLARGNGGTKELSGDSFSCFHLGEGNVLVGLCDGMGRGEQAQKESARAMEMAEHLAEAGFSTEDLLCSLHRMLLLEGNIHPVAMDVGRIDLYAGTLELIKAGSAMTLRKRGARVDVMHSAAAPIGVLPENTASSNRYDLQAEDILLFMTDGVTEAGVAEEDIQSYCQQSNPNSLKEFAEDVLYYVNVNGQPGDDQTLLAIQILTEDSPQ